MTGDVYKLEDLRLKIAEAQKQANLELAKAKTKELRILERMQNEKKEITDIYKYLLDVQFGKMFRKITYLYNLDDYDKLLLELSKLYSLYLAKDFRSVEDKLDYYNEPDNANYMGTRLASEYFNNYNKFIALGHPGYELSREYSDYDSAYNPYITTKTLKHLKYSKYELEAIFSDAIEKAFKKLFELKEAIEKEEEKKKIEADKKKAEIEEAKRKLAELEGEG